MNIRTPYRAGSFYEASPAACRSEATSLIDAAGLPPDLPQTLYGGLVPHAGWMFSGKLAAETLKALIAHTSADTFVLFGSDHTGSARQGEVYDSGAWRTPLGDVPVDEALASALLAADPCLRANPNAHAHEHSIEVQVPLIQILSAAAKIVPIAVPAAPQAVRIGQVVGEALAARDAAAVVIGSTDLTHHGGHFPAPGGRGAVGEQWSRQNDRRMIDLIEAMAADKIVPEAQQRMNACGAGAIAAAISACEQLGATRGICLEYTNSYELTHALHPGYADDTTVGYASMVFA